MGGILFFCFLKNIYRYVLFFLHYNTICPREIKGVCSRTINMRQICTWYIASTVRIFGHAVPQVLGTNSGTCTRQRTRHIALENEKGTRRSNRTEGKRVSLER